MQAESVQSSSLSRSAMTQSPECIVVGADGERRVVDLFPRSFGWAAALEGVDVYGIEMRRFRFDKQLSLEQFDRLFTTVKASLRLQSLLLEDCVVTDHVVAFIVETLVHGNTLISLIVRRCRHVSMTSLMALASLVKVAPLTTLELSSCHLARQAGILLGQALQTARLLKRINIAGNNLRDGGLKAITDGLRTAQAPNSSLDELDCSSNGITASALSAVVMVRVKRLVAIENSITTFPLSVLTSNRCLESLDLSGNVLTNEGMRNLLTQALEAPSLAILNIQNCALSQENEEFLTKSLLLKSTMATGCGLREVYLGDKASLDDVLDDKDESPLTSAQMVRLEELKRFLESRVAGLSVYLLEPFGIDEQPDHQREDDAGDGDDLNFASIAVTDEIELETPGRQTRRELLERTEFLRRRSEELPLADDDESLASFVSDKLTDKCHPPKRMSRAATSLGREESDNELVSMSRHPSSTFVPPQFQHSTSNASFFLTHANPSLDDVASQFSIDPPLSTLTSALQNTDVEFIVSRTIETMNRNFEQRLTQFLMRMEFQQQEKNASQLQMLSAKVEACERAIPRLEARLDVLADRIATSGAQVTKMQTKWQNKQVAATPISSMPPLTSTTPLTLAMQSQVDELVSSRLRSSESQVQSEVASLRRELSLAAATPMNPQAVVDAVSVHLSHFKQEFDANQSTVLRRFTENIVKDGVRVEERMQQLEGKVAHLEGIIQAEQHASLLALEAISEAFTANNTPTPLSAGTSIAPVAPIPPLQPQPYVSKPILPMHGYTMGSR